MGTTSKRSTDSQFLGHRWFLLQVRCSILHIVRASHSTNEEECSNVLERTLQSECFGAKVKIGVRTYPHVANAICGVRCVNVCISEKNGMCTRVTRQSGSLCHKAIEKSLEKNYPTHDLEFAAVLYAVKIYGRMLSTASNVKFILITRDSGKRSRKRI